MEEQIQKVPQTDQPIESQTLVFKKPCCQPKTVLLVILGLIVVAGIAFGAYTYGKKQTTTSSLPKEKEVTKPTPTSETGSTAKIKIYTNEKYGFSFFYPIEWVLNSVSDSELSLSKIASGHTINIKVWRVTGFGYCYNYGDKKEITIGGRNAETADGVGGSEMCDTSEDLSDRGNSFVLIPLNDVSDLPANQIHISYDYPLSDISLAKSNLNKTLSTFRFD